MDIEDPARMPTATNRSAPEHATYDDLHAWLTNELTKLETGEQLYLSEAHTEFLPANNGEELGFFMTLLVVLLFLGILVCGVLISARAPDAFGQLVGFGCTVMLVLQAAINIGVVTGCMPTKGLPLPFISYGGSSLVMSVASVCVLLNISEHVGRKRPDGHTRLIKDRAHQL